jgi:phosphate starvation-inducible PhoH-like protein
LKPVDVTFRPVDNQRLAALCGALDENLRQIETALDVGIARRGERFALTGKADQTRVAAQLLRSFYERAGRGLSLEDVQLGLIEAATPHQVRESGGSPQLITRRQDLHGRTQRQVQYLQNILSHDLTFSIGPAGTGKTYLAVACAVDALEREAVKRIVLVRPAVEAGERLGFLPGDMAAKVDPYLRPLYDALYDLMGFDKVAKMFDRGAIEIAPLAFMRGRTLSHAMIILDEAQNTTSMQMKMFLTRIGEGSKMIVTGDPTQIDLPAGKDSGLLEAVAILEGIEDIAHIAFTGRDVVRRELVGKIVDAYEAAPKQGERHG